MKSIDQITREIADKCGPEELCNYCIYEDGCPRGVTGTPSGPSYPPCADNPPEDWFDLDSYIEGEREMLEIKKIIYNNPATIVWFADGEKVVVKAHNEVFDKEKGVAMAIARKLYSRSAFVKLVESGENQRAFEDIIEKTTRRKFEMNEIFKVGDKVEITNSQGEYIGVGRIANVSDLREPSQKYAVEVDFYHDFIFAWDEHLKLIKEED